MNLQVIVLAIFIGQLSVVVVLSIAAIRGAKKREIRQRETRKAK